MSLPNQRLATQEVAFEYFVGSKVGRKVSGPGGELWLPVGVDFSGVALEWANGEGFTANDLGPDHQMLDRLERRRRSRHAEVDVREVVQGHARRAFGRGRLLLGPRPNAPADCVMSEPLEGGRMTWKDFQKLRLGVREIDRRVRGQADDPADPALSSVLVGHFKALRTMLADEWTDEHAAAASQQLEGGRATPLVTALFLMDAFEEVEALEAWDQEVQGREEQRWSGRGDLWSEPDLEDDYPAATSGDRAWAQRVVGWAEKFGVVSIRDLAALAGFEPDSVPHGYGCYFEAGQSKAARDRWKGARHGYRKRIAAAGSERR